MYQSLGISVRRDTAKQKSTSGVARGATCQDFPSRLLNVNIKHLRLMPECDANMKDSSYQKAFFLLVAMASTLVAMASIQQLLVTKGLIACTMCCNENICCTRNLTVFHRVLQGKVALAKTINAEKVSTLLHVPTERSKRLSKAIETPEKEVEQVLRKSEAYDPGTVLPKAGKLQQSTGKSTMDFISVCGVETVFFYKSPSLATFVLNTCFILCLSFLLFVLRSTVILLVAQSAECTTTLWRS